MSHTSPMSRIKHCPFNHGSYYSLECPKCNELASEGYKMEQSRLMNVRVQLNEFFTLWNVGEFTLDYILQHCLNLPEVIQHLAHYDLESIEYYMQRAKIVRMIQGQIEAYIDNKLEPQ